jgi:CHAT domain-containing protein/Tfp pilus assembly protein PilF
LSHLWRKAGDYLLASAYVNKALVIHAQRPGASHLELAHALQAAGCLEAARGEYDRATSHLSRALSLLHERGKSSSLLAAQTYIWLGACHAHKGEYARAMEFQNKALEICRAMHSSEVSVGNCYALIGEQYSNLGDYNKAADYLTQALQLLRSSRKARRSAPAGPLNLLGKVYLELGEHRKALDCVDQAIALRTRSLGADHPALRYAYETKGDIHRKRGEFNRATKYYRRALEISEQIDANPNRYDVIRLLIAMGLTRLERGELKQADSLLRSSLARASRSTTKSPVQMAAVHKALGDLLCRKEQFSDALQEYRKSLSYLSSGSADSVVSTKPAANEVRNAREVASVLTAQGKALQRLSRARGGDTSHFASALGSFEAALDLNDRARRKITSQEAKLFHEERIASLHETALDLATELFRLTGDPSYRERAFALAERSRAQVLLESIDESQVEHFGGIPDSILQREDALEADAHSLDVMIDRGLAGLDSLGPERLAALQQRRFAARLALDRLGKQMQSEFPTYYESRSSHPSVPLETLRHVLGTDAALVEYFAGRSKLHIFVVRSGNLHMVTVPGTTITGDVQEFLAALKSIDHSSYLQYGARLYASTIAPVRHLLQGATKLVIVPDGPLCFVPFEALFGPRPVKGGQGKRTVTTDLPFLVKDFDMTYSYSATFFTRSVERNRIAPSEQSFVGFAPVFADSERAATMAASEMTSPHHDPSMPRSVTVDGNHFGELKYSEDEVRSIGSSFKRSGLPAFQFLRESATEHAFKRRTGEARFVHVATHGLIDGEHPRLSGLLFSSPAASSKEDGILYAGETYDLKLDADLLVLSSCQSGTGKLLRGEGVMAITRGFFYAGARNIVVSLWRVYDKQTAHFMREFYGHVLEGTPYARALREAKLTMIDDPSSVFPSKWAGFILLGR